MNPEPPPLPLADAVAPHESAGQTYGYAIGILMPTVILFIFSNLIIMPKLGQIWRDAGISTSAAWWLFESVCFFFDHGRWIICAVVILLLLLERYASWWPRRRKLIVLALTISINTLMLLGFTAATITVLAAAPTLAVRYHKKQMEKLEQGMQPKL